MKNVLPFAQNAFWEPINVQLFATSWRRDVGARLATVFEWCSERQRGIGGVAHALCGARLDFESPAEGRRWGRCRLGTWAPVSALKLGWSHGSSRCSLRTETAEKSLTTPEKVANRFWQWKSERGFERSSEFYLVVISICASLPVRSSFPPVSKMIRVKMVSMTGSNNTQRLLSGGGLRFPFTTAEPVNRRTGERGGDSGAAKIRINFDQTQEAYKSKNSLELLRSLVVFKLCSYDVLVDRNKEVM